MSLVFDFVYLFQKFEKYELNAVIPNKYWRLRHLYCPWDIWNENRWYKFINVNQKPEKEWKRFENAHEAIIEKYIFDLIQRLLKLDTRTSPYDNKLRIFSGLIICSRCGGRMSPKSVSYKGTDVKYNYYHCPTTKKRGCKDGVWF